MLIHKTIWIDPAKFCQAVAADMKVSVETARRWFDELERGGFVRRVEGAGKLSYTLSASRETLAGLIDGKAARERA